jgi:hypothetical protein
MTKKIMKMACGGNEIWLAIISSGGVSKRGAIGGGNAWLMQWTAAGGENNAERNNENIKRMASWQ